jgi:hypothetical protein
MDKYPESSFGVGVAVLPFGRARLLPSRDYRSRLGRSLALPYVDPF